MPMSYLSLASHNGQANVSSYLQDGEKIRARVKRKKKEVSSVHILSNKSV